VTPFGATHATAGLSNRFVIQEKGEPAECAFFEESVTPRGLRATSRGQRLIDSDAALHVDDATVAT
jgi:hypothetical protein